TLALIVTMMPMNLTNVNAKSTTRLSSKKIVLQVGKTKKLKVKNKPAGVKVVWKSSKKKVATVSKKGKVKAKKPGKTTITAKVGKKKYKCKVIVKRKNSIKVTKPSDNNNSVINQVTTKSEPSQIVTTKAEVKTTKTETTKKNDSTTVKPTVAPTTVAPTLKPTEKPTTVAPTTNTNAQTTTKKQPSQTTIKSSVNVGKAVVKKAIKKKNAKKISLTLKRVKGATKYKVQIAKDKKFKKTIVTKTTKKLTYSVSNSKFIKAKKLYARAKAIVVKGEKTYQGKWSKPKQVEIKK
ncbi:Ig-like domain-containing protein, partial [uncultured Eubacterium sp.]|uniref:Ig-like domain-containing protein n=1 Tax=uncultured Eubacterium sp. TaxID=165185 RepID=UPI0032636C8E